MFLATYEIFVSKALSILSVSGLVEVVHVQLPDETRKVVVLEVFGQHILSEFICFIDYEARTI